MLLLVLYIRTIHASTCDGHDLYYEFNHEITYFLNSSRLCTFFLTVINHSCLLAASLASAIIDATSTPVSAAGASW
jgi:hypothetical protein